MAVDPDVLDWAVEDGVALASSYLCPTSVHLGAEVEVYYSLYILLIRHARGMHCIQRTRARRLSHASRPPREGILTF